MFILSSIFLPSKLNKNVELRKPNRSQENIHHGKEITYSMLVHNRRALVAFIITVFGIIFMIFFESIFSLRLKEMGVEEDMIGISTAILIYYIGLYFAFGSLAYALTAPAIGVLCRHVEKIYIT